MKLFSTRLPEETLKLLEHFCHKNDYKIQKVVKDAIVEYISNIELMEQETNEIVKNRNKTNS